MKRAAWQILTGEYPPEPGGVADYTAQVAAGLAARGDEVHIWTSRGGPSHGDDGVIVHRVAGWSAADLVRLDRGLEAFAAPRRLLVQYTPNAWGRRGLNLRFCRWLADRGRSRGDAVRLMFHEVAYPWLLRDRPTRWLLAAGHRRMARLLLESGGPVDVSTPAWEPLLRRCGASGEIAWRPVPSNIPVVVDPEAVAAIRREIAPEGGPIVGSFSSFSGLSGRALAATLPRVLAADTRRIALLIGRGSTPFASRLIDGHTDLVDRVVGTGDLSPRDVSLHLQACDLMIQPYDDGATTRRTSLMAALAHGVAVASNRGHLTEPLWAEFGAPALALGVESIAAEVDRLLADPIRRATVAAEGRELYRRRFALEWTIEALSEWTP